MEVSTIAAISTPPGHGGIGIIKISGPNAVPAGLSIFRAKKTPTPHSVSASKALSTFIPRSRYLYYGHIVEKKSGRIIDEVLFVVMRGPASYTGEDVVEIHSHAGPVVLRSILKLLLGEGISLAAPGEFTRRAFTNGRIDLTQAEAVMDMISAHSEIALEMAAAQVSGQLQHEILSLRSALLDILAFVEAAIDFPDEVDSEIDAQYLCHRLDTELIVKIARLVTQAESGGVLREGLKIVIIGGPNVGKSSLMNCLMDRDRSIVSDIPGTTRDFIEDTFIAQGIPLLLVDTAGIRATEDTVESLGIEKTWQTIHNADLILFVLDASRPIRSDDEEIISHLSKKSLLLVVNKMDLHENQRKFRMPEDWQALKCIGVSALFNQGIDALKGLIVETAIGGPLDLKTPIIPNLRHKQCLESALQALTIAREGLACHRPFELIAVDLGLAMEALLEITGEHARVDILDQIFSRFCIGK